MTLTLGAQKLAKKGTQVEIARRLEVTQQAVSYWLTGRRVPTGKTALAIQETYRIPIADWYRAAVEARG